MRTIFALVVGPALFLATTPEGLQTPGLSP